MEGSHLGLGYFHGAVTAAGSSEARREDHAAPNAAVSAENDATALMRQHLQQCLAYHEEQEVKRRNQHQETQHVEVETQFVPAIKVEMEDDFQVGDSQEKTHVESNSQAQVLSDEALEKKAQEGRLRVQAILLRFQQKQEELLQTSSAAVVADDDLGGEQQISIYQEQRLAAAKLQDARKHVALLKNLEYVAAKEHERYQQLTAQAEQTREHQQRMQEHQQSVLKERKRARGAAASAAKLDSQAGIGTKQRRNVEKIKRVQGHVPRGRQQADNEQYSVAVYLSGLPTDESIGENYIRQLFASYGTILKLKYYRNRKTGNNLKGDGLVIYQISRQDESAALLQMVCSQVGKVRNWLQCQRKHLGGGSKATHS